MSTSATTEQVWTRMRSDLSAFFRRRVRDEHLSEDLLQDTFLRVHDGLAGLASEERLVPWVFRVARNVLADHRRVRARRGDEDAHAEPSAEPAAEDDGEENFNAEVNRWLGSMLGALSPEERQAVELAEVGGLEQRAIAERLGLSLSGAKSRVQRGRAHLREVLLDCCHLDFDRRGNVVDYTRRSSTASCCQNRREPT